MKRIASTIAIFILLFAMLAVSAQSGHTMPPPTYIDTPRVDFGTWGTNQTVTFFNHADEPLVWETLMLSDTGDSPSWISFEQEGGIVAEGANAPVKLSVNRLGLPPGLYQETFFIMYEGSGWEGVHLVTVTMEVFASPPLQFQGMCFFLSAAKTEDALYLMNESAGEVAWSTDMLQIDYSGGQAGWLFFETQQGLIESGERDEIIISIDRTGLAPGYYVAVISSLDSGNGNPVVVVLRVSAQVNDFKRR
ncbi:MAG: hypothetical protein GY868_06665 [Deltaproteobacteria bacterium]|nr:hypothetical protein [Deltaproteobacteria bacterium]